MNIKTIGLFLILFTFLWSMINSTFIPSHGGCRTRNCSCSCPCCNGKKPKSILKKRPKYIVYGTSRCGYTVKLLEEIKERDTTKEFMYKDITQEENRKEYEKLGVDGVPVTVSVTEPDKVIVGYRPYDKMIQALRE